MFGDQSAVSEQPDQQVMICQSSEMCLVTNIGREENKAEEI